MGRPQVLLIIAVTMGLSVLSSGLSYSFLIKTPDGLRRAVYLNTTYWIAWALLTPLIIHLARRYRFDRQTWRGALAVHVPALVVACFAHVAMTVIARQWAGYIREGWTFWMSLRDTFLSQVDWEMMTYCAIVGITHAVDYRRAAAEREIQAARLETSLAEARLQALQHQLQPHFLFNTLHGISALMRRDPDAAERVIVLLADLLRASLDVRRQEIPLKDELDLLYRYVDIERIRFGNRLTVTYDIDAETLDARVPSFLLQPLVENAIKHGIAPMSVPGRVVVHARRQGQSLWIEVRDDGVGLSQDAFQALQRGIGLSNTRSRLSHLYGPRHGFEFVRPAARGLWVRIVLPWHVEAAPPAPAAAALETA